LRNKPRQDGRGAGTVIFVLVVLILVVMLGIKVFSQEAPAIRLMSHVKGIGKSTTLQFEVADPEHRIQRVSVRIEQNGQVFKLPVAEASAGAAKTPWWKFWGPRPASRVAVTTHAGQKEIPALKQGRARLVIVAVNNSWGRFFRGGRSVVTFDLPVRFSPPQVYALTTENDVTLGGTGMVVFRVSQGTVTSGVKVGPYFFRSWRMPGSKQDTRLCLFAYPYGVDPSTPARIIARDDAGNETIADFSYRVLPRKFHNGKIVLTDAFMERLVPPIMSQTPQLKDQGSLLKNFLQINRQLRQIDTELLFKYGQQTSGHFLWSQPFLQLPQSKVEAYYGDARSYFYNGQVVDHEVHLGYDLASVAHAPVPAANDGKVVFTGYLGIFGNAVILDHGCGLETLYGHLSRIDVKPGETVKRGQTLGHTGETGLAAGDHLHFGVLLDGIQVDPIEWWDPHWIHDQILMKLTADR
jgi:murein DD-endopeptidase MepM/ murein hydrolase activator NlpD